MKRAPRLRDVDGREYDPETGERVSDERRFIEAKIFNRALDASPTGLTSTTAQP